MEIYKKEIITIDNLNERGSSLFYNVGEVVLVCKLETSKGNFNMFFEVQGKVKIKYSDNNVDSIIDTKYIKDNFHTDDELSEFINDYDYFHNRRKASFLRRNGFVICIERCDNGEVIETSEEIKNINSYLLDGGLSDDYIEEVFNAYVFCIGGTYF